MLLAAALDRLAVIAQRSHATRDDLADVALAADALDVARRTDERLELSAGVLFVLCAQLEALGDEERVPLVAMHRKAIGRALECAGNGLGGGAR